MNNKKLEKAGSTNKSDKSERKPAVKTKTDNIKKADYPLWTMPEHLKEKDHKDLKRVCELHLEKKFDIALHFASDLDTLVREAIPSDIWLEIGGKLTSLSIEGDEDVLEKVQESQIGEITIDSECVQNSIDREKVLCEETKDSDNTLISATEPEMKIEVVKEVIRNLSNCQFSYFLKNDKLQAFTDDFFIDENAILEAKFHFKEDMEDFIIQNHKVLFGENTVILDNTKSTNQYFPSLFLFDFNDRDKPRLFILELNISNDNLNLLYARITHFIASIKHKKYQNDFFVEFCNVTYANNDTRTELRNWMYDDQEISDLLSYMIGNKPAILILKDNENAVLDLMQTVYVDTWGKMTKQILIKKYYCNDDTLYFVNPLFPDIWKVIKNSKDDSIKVTEIDHLCELPDRIRKIYNDIKISLLAIDDTLEFNPKKHYISIRKKKNLAFIHLRRKQADIVVMNPEESTRELIKLHKIKSLPPSVQKFWNGECCTIVVENANNLGEVIELLKIIIVK